MNVGPPAPGTGAPPTRQPALKRGPRRLGLFPYFFVCFSLLAVLPTLGLGLFQAGQWEAEEIEREQRTLTFAGQALARQVGQLMDGYARGVGLVAGQLSLDAALDPTRLRAALEEFRARFGAFQSAKLTPGKAAVSGLYGASCGTVRVWGIGRNCVKLLFLEYSTSPKTVKRFSMSSSLRLRPSAFWSCPSNSV